jgi:hypothetical protein
LELEGIIDVQGKLRNLGHYLKIARRNTIYLKFGMNLSLKRKHLGTLRLLPSIL